MGVGVPEGGWGKEGEGNEVTHLTGGSSSSSGSSSARTVSYPAYLSLFAVAALRSACNLAISSSSEGMVRAMTGEMERRPGRSGGGRAPRVDVFVEDEVGGPRGRRGRVCSAEARLVPSRRAAARRFPKKNKKREEEKTSHRRIPPLANLKRLAKIHTRGSGRMLPISSGATPVSRDLCDGGVA